jgi:hypothetical protein
VVTTKSEALDLFSKWHSDNTKIHCDLSTRRYAVTMVGRIKSLDASKLVVGSSDGTGECVLPLTSSLHFGYGDAPGSEHILVVWFDSPVGATSAPDHLALYALE